MNLSATQSATSAEEKRVVTRKRSSEDLSLQAVQKSPKLMGRNIQPPPLLKKDLTSLTFRTERLAEKLIGAIPTYHDVEAKQAYQFATKLFNGLKDNEEVPAATLYHYFHMILGTPLSQIRKFLPLETAAKCTAILDKFDKLPNYLLIYKIEEILPEILENVKTKI